MLFVLPGGVPLPGLPFMDVFAVQPVVDGRVEDDPHQKHFDGQHHRVFDGTRGQVVKIPLAVEHGFPHTAQQHVTAVVDDEPHHNNAQQRRFALIQQQPVNQAGEHRRDEVAGEIRLAVAREQKAHRVDDGPSHHAHTGAVAHAAQAYDQKAEVNFQARAQQVDGKAFQHNGHGADQARKGQHADIFKFRAGGAPVSGGKDGQFCFLHTKNLLAYADAAQARRQKSGVQGTPAVAHRSCSSGMRDPHRRPFGLSSCHNSPLVRHFTRVSLLCE